MSQDKNAHVSEYPQDLPSQLTINALTFLKQATGLTFVYCACILPASVFAVGLALLSLAWLWGRVL